MRPAAGPALALAAALAVTLSCAPAKRPPPPPQELVFWAPWPAEVLAPALGGFERAHPGLRVRVEAMPDSVRARRIAEADGGAVPDLCAIGTEDMPALLAGGRLVDWSAAVADLRPLLRGWETCTVGDALYGIPWRLAPRSLRWNPDLLARAGFRGPPATWAELQRASSRVQRLGRGVRGFGVPAGPTVLEDGLLPLVASAGSGVLSGDRRHATLDSAEVARALELLVRLRRSGLLASPDSLERAFAAGRLGMLISPPGPGPRVGDRSAPVPHPDADTSGGSWATGLVLVSFNTSRHRHAALDLARHLVGPESQDGLSRRAGGSFPATAAPESTLSGGRTSTAAGMRGLDRSRYAPAHPSWRAVRDTLADEVDAALRGAKTPGRAVADARTRLARILRR